MRKQAETAYEINSLLASRWSPRAFADRPVEPEKINRLFEAARWAASSNNEQPWSFLVGVKGEPQHEKLAACLMEGNRWAAVAPLLALSVAKTFFERNAQPNRVAVHDVGLALGNLMLQATDMDLYVHAMAGFDVEKARTEFELPEKYEPVAMFAIGYSGDPAQLSEPYQQRELSARVRKPQEEFVFRGKWGQR